MRFSPSPRSRVIALGAVALLFGLVTAFAAPLLIAAGTGVSLVWLVDLVAVSVAAGVVSVRRAAQHSVMHSWLLSRAVRQTCSELGIDAPSVRSYRGDRDAWTLTVKPAVGVAATALVPLADQLGLLLDRPVRLESLAHSRVRISAGYQQIRPRPVPRSRVNLSGSRAASLESVPIGVTDTGEQVQLPLLYSHTLIIGQTGAGKGSLIWSIVRGLLPEIRAGLVRVWGLDPKRVELSLGRGLFAEYAADPVELVELLERAVTEMHERAARMEGTSRKHLPTDRDPLELIVIDELAYLSVMLPDRKLQDRGKQALQTLLVLGRALGYVVIGASQDPRKEVLSTRDLYPSKLALRLETPMVDLALGTGARAAGAAADEIPRSQPGTCWLVAEDSRPQRLRAYWSTDTEIQLDAKMVVQHTRDTAAPLDGARSLLQPSGTSVPLDKEIAA